MQREAEELVADWSSDLEAVLYHPEVEEAIREVRMLDPSSPSHVAETGMASASPRSLLPPSPRCARPPTLSTAKTSIQLTISTNSSLRNR